jgi:predicted ThiF/HesA family dinucleotide-utilizing enzyme
MSDKIYAVAGVSTQAGKTKVRFANDVMRTKILQKNGHTDIILETLPQEMTKADAVAHLIAIGLGDGNPAVAEALKQAAKKYGVKTVAEAAPAEVPAEVVAE